MGNMCSSNLKTPPPTTISYQFNNTVISLQLGDITSQVTDVIIYSTFADLRSKGLPGESILLKGGPQVSDQCSQLIEQNGSFPVGSTIVTNSGDLDCQKLIHAVSPIYINGSRNQAEYLHKIIVSSLDTCESLELKVLSFAPLSSGIFNFPVIESASVHWQSIINYLLLNPYSGFSEIRVVVDKNQVFKVFRDELKKLFSLSGTKLIEVQQKKKESEQEPKLVKRKTVSQDILFQRV